MDAICAAINAFASMTKRGGVADNISLIAEPIDSSDHVRQ
jgi:hypothetical protein